MADEQEEEEGDEEEAQAASSAPTAAGKAKARKTFPGAPWREGEAAQDEASDNKWQGKKPQRGSACPYILKSVFFKNLHPKNYKNCPASLISLISMG